MDNNRSDSHVITVMRANSHFVYRLLPYVDHLITASRTDECALVGNRLNPKTCHIDRLYRRLGLGS